VIVDQPRMPVPAANTAGSSQSRARPAIRAAGEPSAPRVHGLPNVRNALTGQPRPRPHPYGPACPGNYWCQQCGPGQPAPRTAPAVIRQGNDQSADQQWGSAGHSRIAPPVSHPDPRRQPTGYRAFSMITSASGGHPADLARGYVADRRALTVALCRQAVPRWPRAPGARRIALAIPTCADLSGAAGDRRSGSEAARGSSPVAQAAGDRSRGPGRPRERRMGPRARGNCRGSKLDAARPDLVAKSSPGGPCAVASSQAPSPRARDWGLTADRAWSSPRRCPRPDSELIGPTPWAIESGERLRRPASSPRRRPPPSPGASFRWPPCAPSPSRPGTG